MVPKVTVIVGVMFCFAVGVIVYCGAVVRAVRVDAVISAYVAPVEEIA
jgi:hypothetical protein